MLPHEFRRWTRHQLLELAIAFTSDESGLYSLASNFELAFAVTGLAPSAAIPGLPALEAAGSIFIARPGRYSVKRRVIIDLAHPEAPAAIHYLGHLKPQCAYCGNPWCARPIPIGDMSEPIAAMVLKIAGSIARRRLPNLARTESA